MLSKRSEVSRPYAELTGGGKGIGDLEKIEAGRNRNDGSAI
jgi:hypothetical protein